VFFFAYPWEHYLGTQAEVNEGEDAYRLYASLARAAGIEARVSATDPRLQVHVVEAGERDLVWAINRSWNEVGGQVKLPGEATLLFPESAAEKGPIGEGGAHRRRTSMHSGSGGRVLAPFAPKEVRVYAVPHAGPE
jgi:hypothetical protein